MKEIVNLTVRGSIGNSGYDTLTLNGKDFGVMLSSMLGGKAIENAVVTITISDSSTEEKETESDETV